MISNHFCEVYVLWTNPRSSTLQNSNYATIYLPSYKPPKKENRDMLTQLKKLGRNQYWRSAKDSDLLLPKSFFLLFFQQWHIFKLLMIIIFDKFKKLFLMLIRWVNNVFATLVDSESVFRNVLAYQGFVKWTRRCSFSVYIELEFIKDIGISGKLKQIVRP